MNNYFITLVGPLAGYCILVVAKDEITARKWAANTLGRLWCSVYAYRPTEILIGTTTYL